MSAIERLTERLRNPRWQIAYWRARRARIPTEARARFWLEEHASSLYDSAGALAAVTSEPRERCEAALAEARMPEPIDDDPPVWWPREMLVRLVSAATRLTAARTAVEVGVARGYTSAAILCAQEASSAQVRLHSIDLPPRDTDERRFVGRAVPERVRDRWQLELGPSRALLPALAGRLGSIDLFVHDGDHSYRSQREDLATVWPHLRPGAVVIVDDIWTPAIFDFATEVGERAAVAETADHSDGIGLLRRSEA